jgi:hypothetical protein
MINTFINKFYERHPELVHPFLTKQDAGNFSYVVIMSIMATTITQEDFITMSSEVCVPLEFLKDMYSYIMEKRNLAKKGVVEGVEVIEKTDSALCSVAQETQTHPSIPATTTDTDPAQTSYCCVM